MDDVAPHLPGTDRRSRMRRLVRRLLVLDLVLVLAALGVWLVLRDDPRENVVNDGLRGSKPPAGQRVADLTGIPGIEPAVPTPEELRGTAIALAVTCMDCPSGDILGGFLGRLAEDDVPSSADIRVVAWHGDVEAWRSRWRIKRDISIHKVPDAHVEDARDVFGIRPVRGQEESGMVFLYDEHGRWRSTFFLGQVNRADVTHDLQALGP